MLKRQFSPYELNQLRKYGLMSLDLDSIGNKPVEYVTGHAQFCDLDFLVNSSTLIPRLESEEIISISKSFLQSLNTNDLNIADIGTGSGCLGISIAHSLLDQSINDFHIWLSDLSDQALEIARNNVHRLLSDHYPKFNFLISDLLSEYPTDQKFDLVVANLPYIPSTRISKLDSSVKDYEPVSALDGGPDGTEIINNLLLSVERHLEPNFRIILEIDNTQTIDSFTIPSKFKSEIKKDIFDRPRFLIIYPS
jgi:release factor glutamine methyltransferase